MTLIIHIALFCVIAIITYILLDAIVEEFGRLERRIRRLEDKFDNHDEGLTDHRDKIRKLIEELGYVYEERKWNGMTIKAGFVKKEQAISGQTTGTTGQTLTPKK